MSEHTDTDSLFLENLTSFTFNMFVDYAVEASS